MSGLWVRLGFKENPYFTTPINISEEGSDLFVGRGAEIRRLVGKWDESNGAITIVGGNIGTGKTSFLNVCQYLCMTGKKDFGLEYDPPRLLPAFSKVQLESTQSDQEFLVRIIESAALSIKHACEHFRVTVPDEISRTLYWLGSTPGAPRPLGTVETATAVLQVSPRTPATTQAPQESASLNELVNRLERLAKATTAIAGQEYRGLIVAIDNIEMVDSEQTVSLLNKYRDTLFAANGVWWVLIGQRGLFDLIDAEAPRVAQRIKGTETTLEGLSWDDFNLAIQARIDHFRTRDDAVAPIGEGLLQKLFHASAGEIRYVFKMADEIITDAIAEFPRLQNVPPETAENMLKQSVYRQVQRLELDERERRILRLMCERKSARPKDCKEYGVPNAPHFIQLVLQPLQAKGLVSKSTQGNAAVYSPRPLARLALDFDMLSPRQVSLLTDNQ
ncbi:hypothetical protein [Sorangium sp. So ce362]|uniref:hypothetical protein n=1 Tax=Sorangium sp. So ce362 TaxID=3133303 RepID=UPI003F603DA0